jgi:ribosome-associated protein
MFRDHEDHHSHIYSFEDGASTLIEITPDIRIGEHELEFSFDRSSGPGGQNVNKVNTRVTLEFNLRKSLSLSNAQKTRIRKSLGNRVNREGVLRISSSKERTQLANRRAAVNRLVELMHQAVETPKPRTATRPTAASKRKRVEDKRQRGTLKRSRTTSVTLED